jgi:hypothetical protein
MTRAKKICPAGRIVDTAKLGDDPGAASLRVVAGDYVSKSLVLSSKKNRKKARLF